MLTIVIASIAYFGLYAIETLRIKDAIEEAKKEGYELEI